MTEPRSYGVAETAKPSSETATAILRDGYAIVQRVLSERECDSCAERLDRVYAKQVGEVGADLLERTMEKDVARSLLMYDRYFFETLVNHETVRDLVTQLLGEFHILHLQNGIINRPSNEHHQNAWHRDLPYQSYSTSQPIGVSVLYCIDEFDDANGGTLIVPASHRLSEFPTAQYCAERGKQLIAPAGSVIIFDSFIYHRAGRNASNAIRRAVNHVFTVPIVKQQIDLPEALGPDFPKTPRERQLLGYTSKPAGSVLQYRLQRDQRRTPAEDRESPTSR